MEPAILEVGLHPDIEGGVENALMVSHDEAGTMRVVDSRCCYANSVQSVT